jgi:hypothetical protein
MAHGKRGQVAEADASARSSMDLQVDCQRHKIARHQSNETGVTEQLRKLLAQMDLDVLRVDVTAEETADSRRHGNSDDPTMSLRYRSETGVDETRIWPDMDYLTALQAGGPLKPVILPGIPFSWDWPTLEVKVVNNSGQTVTITRADFRILQSQTILDPVPIFVDFGHHAPLKMLIVDEGLGAIESAQLRFNLVPYTESISRNLADTINFDRPYAHEVTVQDFAHWTEVDLSAAFEDEGVDTAAVLARGLGPNVFRAGDHYRVAKAGRYADMSLKDFEEIAPSEFGKFKSGGALIYGEMTYAWRTGEGELRAYPNNPAARNAIKPQAKCRNAR